MRSSGRRRQELPLSDPLLPLYPAFGCAINIRASRWSHVRFPSPLPTTPPYPSAFPTARFPCKIPQFLIAVCDCLQTGKGHRKLIYALSLWVVLAGVHRLLGVQEVEGSNPFAPTIFRKKPFGENVEGLFAWNQAIPPPASEFNQRRLWQRVSCQFAVSPFGIDIIAIQIVDPGVHRSFPGEDVLATTERRSGGHCRTRSVSSVPHGVSPS
jgi:hypothetical protein